MAFCHAWRLASPAGLSLIRRHVRRLSSASEVVSSVGLPSPPLLPEDALSAVKKLLSAAESSDVQPMQLMAERPAQDFLMHLGELCSDFQPQQLRELLVSFAALSHMPSTLWSGGLAEEVPRALDELPSLHVVHIALLLSALDLRDSSLLFQEVAEQLEQRAPELPPAGLAGATVALSQLGPWHQVPPPGGAVFESVLQSLAAMSPRELSASALAAATLGHGAPVFWQQMHGALIACTAKLQPRHMADTLLALATHQLCPITLLEELQSQLPRVAPAMEPDEALTTAWAMTSLLLFSPGVLPVLLEKALAAELGPSEARQLRQIALSLRLENSAARVREALTPEVTRQLGELPADSGQDGVGGAAAQAAVEWLCERLEKDGVSYTLFETVEELYTLDMAIFGGKEQGAKVALVLDAESAISAQAPQNPWTGIKRRHLQKLGWLVEWLPVRRWDMMDDEEREALAERLLQISE